MPKPHLQHVSVQQVVLYKHIGGGNISYRETIGFTAYIGAVVQLD